MGGDALHFVLGILQKNGERHMRIIISPRKMIHIDRAHIVVSGWSLAVVFFDLADKVTGLVSEVKKYYSQTPTGYYNVGSVDVDHFSGAYDDSHMPFAVFLEDSKHEVEGVATHVGSEPKLIGYRESH